MIMSNLPGWYKDLQDARDDPRISDSLTFALATLSKDGMFPEVRHIGLRDLQPFSSFSSSLSSPSSPSGGTQSNCRLIFTTDHRTPKVQELTTHPECSMTTWVSELSLQIRIKAVSKIIHPSIHPGGPSGNGNENGEEEEEGEWEHYRRKLFDSDEMRSRIRAWHANPTPGLRWDNVEESFKKNWTMQLDVPDQTTSPETRKRYEDALSNFALMVFTPYEVDIVRMVATGFDNRIHWKLSPEGQWESTKLVP